MSCQAFHQMPVRLAKSQLLLTMNSTAFLPCLEYFASLSCGTFLKSSVKQLSTGVPLWIVHHGNTDIIKTSPPSSVSKTVVTCFTCNHGLTRCSKAISLRCSTHITVLEVRRYLLTFQNVISRLLSSMRRHNALETFNIYGNSLFHSNELKTNRQINQIKYSFNKNFFDKPRSSIQWIAIIAQKN